MKQIFLIISAALAGIIIFQYLFNSCESNKKEKQITELQDQLVACANAPEVIRVDTVRDTTQLVIRVPVKDYVVVEREVIPAGTDSIEVREYNGVYEHPQFSLHWRANVTGTLNGLYIDPPSLIKSLIITKEKTVNVALNQPKGSTKKEKSHLYANLGVDFTKKEINSTDVSLMYIRKEGWGISAGIGTDFSYLLFRTGLIIKLK